jgi:hypothetical protein
MIKQALLLVKSLILNLNDLIKIKYWRKKKKKKSRLLKTLHLIQYGLGRKINRISEKTLMLPDALRCLWLRF